MTAEEIVTAALELDSDALRDVVARLEARLEEEEIPEQEAEALWLDEAVRRARELREGTVEEIPGDVVMAQARAILA